LITAGLLVAALTGCSSKADASCIVGSGSASKLVSASGSFGSPQAAHFPTPLGAPRLQRSILRQGTGAPLEQGQLVETELTYFDGKTGKKFESANAAIPVTSTPYPGLGEALRCVPLGSRVSIVGSAKAIFGSDRAQQAGFDPSQTLVFIVDAKRASLAKANGGVRPGQPGFPTVVLAPNGQPGVTIPGNDAPKAVSTEVLKQGGGKKVTKKDKLVVNYTAVDWTGKTVTASSWQDGAPVVWDLGADASSGGAPAGLSKELVGSRVGSQLVVIVPATGSTGSATAYVVDLLGTL
jgi:FKBP-type peptidyl-prolyl cis-trans isomerases 1